MLPSQIWIRDRIPLASYWGMISRNAAALVAMTTALALCAWLAYTVLAGVPDAALHPTAVLVTVEMVSLVILAALLLLLCIYRIPVIPAARRVLRRGAAPMLLAAVALGVAVILITPFDGEGAAVLILSCVLTLTAVLLAAVVRRGDATEKALFVESRLHEQAHSEGLGLAIVMQELAQALVIGTGVQACRLFTVSSDRGALVLRGEARHHSMAMAADSAPPTRERLPVQQLPWLERLLQRDSWLHVPSDIVATAGIGHEITRTLTTDTEHGDLSLYALRVGGNPVGVACVVHPPNTSPAARARQLRACDITIGAAESAIERALRLRSLGISGGWWSTAMRDLPYGVAIVNRGTRLVAFNAAAEAAISTSAGTVLGQRVCDGAATCTCPLHLTLRTGDSRQVPLRSIWPFPIAQPAAGQLVNIWATANAGNENKPEFAVIALSATAGSDPAPRIGTEVAAMISHELRAPLATLRASSELALEEMGNPERQRGLLSTISRQVDRLDNLIQDLADVFRLQAGKLQLSREVLDVPELCRELVDDLVGLGTSHRIEVQADESVRAVAADRLKVRTVLNNLVGNAIKYTPEGTQITITIVDTDGGLDVTVADTGPGIAEEDLPHVFEQFYRSPSAASASKGYGLGLYITRALVELHGGQIHVQRGDEHGCRFTFTLPRRPDKAHIAHHQAS